MLLGVLLVSTSQIFWNIRVQSPLTCIVKVPLLVIGGCLLKGSLIAKLLRIYAIFGSKSSHINSNENGRKMNINYRLIKDSFLLWIPTILVAIGLILVILYMTVTGYPRPTTRYNRTGQLISRCQVPVEGVQLAFLLTLIIYQAILLATIIILSMLTRGIENSYSEAKGLSFIANFRLVVFYLFTTVYYQWSNVGNHTSTRQLLVRFTGITLLVLNIIIALFISKLYKAHKEYHSRAQTKQNDLERLQRLADPCVFTTDYSVSGSSIEYNGEDEDGSIVN